MDSWEAIDSGGELRTYRLKIDTTEIQSIDWLKTFLEKEKLQLIPGVQWSKPNISVRTLNLPSDLIEELSKKVDLEKAEYFAWINQITLSFNGTDKLLLDIQTPNVWINADLLTIGNLSSGKYWYTGGVAIDTAASMGGSTGTTTGNMFTFGKKIITVKTDNDLLTELRKQKGKIWGMVVYAHGDTKGNMGSTSQSPSNLNQRALISELQRYGYKLSKIYMMQCYSGYKGTIDVVDIKIPILSQNQIKVIEDQYKKIYNSSYEKVVLVKVVSQKENGKSYYKLTVITQVNWDTGWKTVGLYTYTYQGVNAVLIDFGRTMWHPSQWFK